MQGQVILGQTEITPRASVRLHYLDILRVLAVFMAFLFHAATPFTIANWQVNNAQTSEAVVPFHVLHYPVLLIVAFYVVQWQAGVTVKMLAVLLVSFIGTIGIYELLIRRVAPLRALFGMKAASRPLTTQPEEAAPPSRPGTLPSA